ncbi:unnamed protein product [Rotaria sp. Silwood2]|nr:unnamed protein product [Rotaria sp. Silwood2]
MAIWTVDQVGDWLKANSFEKYVETFKNQDIDGIALFGLQDDDILKLLSSKDEDGTIRNPTIRIQRKFRTILEAYRKLIKQDSSVNKGLDINMENHENNLSIISSKATFHTINDIGTYSKIYTIEPKNIGMKFFKSELICSNLTKYFLKKYNVSCHIPMQNQYDTKDALKIKLSDVKENVYNDIHLLLTTIKTKIFNDKDTDKKNDNVKIQIRENIILSPQYLIMKIKQLVQSMVFQTSTTIFRYIQNAFTLTEKDQSKLKNLAQNYNCEINKINIETKKELIILPKEKNVTTSKYITNESNQYYFSLTIWRKLSMSHNTIEIHKSYGLIVDITIISTTAYGIKEKIDPKYGNGYFESGTGKRVIFIE